MVMPAAPGMCGNTTGANRIREIYGRVFKATALL